MTSPYPLNATDPISLGIFSNLNLSSSQQSQIQSIVGGAQNGHTPFSQVVSQVEALLSPTQQSQFKSDLQQLEIKAGGTVRHHHHGSGTTATSSTSAASTASTPNASNVWNPFQSVAAQYQVQQQLQASLLNQI